MNHESLFLTLAVGATLATAAPAHAEYIPPQLEARLQAAFDQGPDQLRMLVWRTRAVYNLSMDEVVQHLQSPGTTPPETEAADVTDGEGGAPIATPGPKDDSFEREFFRNDARD